MSLQTFAVVLSGIGIPLGAIFAGAYLRNPQQGMALTGHRLDYLPRVMTWRFVAFLLMAAGATFYGDLKVIAYLSGCFALMAFADTIIYARDGHAWSPHLMTGLAAAVVGAVALAAIFYNGSTT